MRESSTTLRLVDSEDPEDVLARIEDRAFFIESAAGEKRLTGQRRQEMREEAAGLVADAHALGEGIVRQLTQLEKSAAELNAELKAEIGRRCPALTLVSEIVDDDQ